MGCDGLPRCTRPREHATSTAIIGVRRRRRLGKVFVWNWSQDEVQAWPLADGDEAGMAWLHNEQRVAWHMRRRCRALHACAWDGAKDFDEAHKTACAKDRSGWSQGLRGMMRRQWKAGLRTRKYRPKRSGSSNAGRPNTSGDTMSNDPFRIVEFKDAGKEFNELLSVRAFLRKHKVRTRDDEWYVRTKKAWVREPDPCICPTQSSSCHKR